jgi:hypothetical protein
VDIEALAHGLTDQALVATLRQAGVTTTGMITSGTEFGTDSDGNTTETTTIWLEFTPPAGSRWTRWIHASRTSRSIYKHV